MTLFLGVFCYTEDYDLNLICSIVCYSVDHRFPGWGFMDILL